MFGENCNTFNITTKKNKNNIIDLYIQLNYILKFNFIFLFKSFINSK